LTKSLDNHKTIKIQKIVRAQGQYAKKNEDIKDSDIITILDGGQVITGEYGDRMVFKVKTRNGERNLAFNQKSLNNIIDAYGEDTESWVGKDVKVWLIRAMVSGKLQHIVYLSHPSWLMTEDGSFHAPNKGTSNDEIPVINEEEPIDLKDIPF